MDAVSFIGPLMLEVHVDRGQASLDRWDTSMSHMDLIPTGCCPPEVSRGWSSMCSDQTLIWVMDGTLILAHWSPLMIWAGLLAARQVKVHQLHEPF